MLTRKFPGRTIIGGVCDLDMSNVTTKVFQSKTIGGWVAVRNAYCSFLRKSTLPFALYVYIAGLGALSNSKETVFAFRIDLYFKMSIGRKILPYKGERVLIRVDYESTVSSVIFGFYIIEIDR